MKAGYSSYGRKAGFTPLPDKKAEFEELSEALFDVNAKLRFHAFYDPGDIYDTLLQTKQEVLHGLELISKPRRNRKVSNP